MRSSPHRRSVAARFSAAARSYEHAAAVHRCVAEELVSLLDGVAEPDRILEIGCGTGLFTEAVAGQYPGVDIEAIDPAAAMIEQAKGKTWLRGRVTWSVRDVLAYEAPPFPLVVSSSSLHWVTPLRTLFRKLNGLVLRGGYLVFSLMLEGTLGELHAARARVAPGKLPRARLPRRSAVLRAVREAGFTVEVSREVRFRSVHESARAFLRHLHELGVTGGDLSVGKRRLTRGDLHALAADYDAHYAEPGGVRATYCVLCVRAAKTKEVGP